MHRRLTFVRAFAVGLACLGLVLPSRSALAVESDAAINNALSSRASAISVSDIELDAGGVLSGQMVDPQGAAVRQAPVVVRHQGRPIADAVTDERGRFAITGLRGGVYELAAADCIQVCRLWMPGTAPPSANIAVLMVSGDPTLRGQFGPVGPIGRWLSTPWVLAGIVTVAVAVPIAVHNFRQDRDSTS